MINTTNASTHAQATCYDIRFPEMYTRLAMQESVDMVCAPSAFTVCARACARMYVCVRVLCEFDSLAGLVQADPFSLLLSSSALQLLSCLFRCPQERRTGTFCCVHARSRRSVTCWQQHRSVCCAIVMGGGGSGDDGGHDDDVCVTCICRWDLTAKRERATAMH